MDSMKSKDEDVSLILENDPHALQVVTATPSRSPLSVLMILVIFFSAMTGLLMGYDLCIIAVILEPITKEFGICPTPSPFPMPNTVSRPVPVKTPHRFLQAEQVTRRQEVMVQRCSYAHKSRRRLDDHDDTRFTSCTPRQLFVGMVSPGAAVGSFIAGFLTDAAGRRFTLMLSDALIMVGTLMMSLAHVFSIAMSGWLILGLGVGTGFVVFSTYVSEISPPDRRGQLVSCQEIAQCIGCLTAYSVAAAASTEAWRLMLTAAGVVAGIQACGILLLPESPRWLVRHSKKQQAERALRRLAGLPATESSTSRKQCGKKNCALREEAAALTMKEMLAEIEAEERAMVANDVRQQQHQEPGVGTRDATPATTTNKKDTNRLESSLSSQIMLVEQKTPSWWIHWIRTFQLCRQNWWPLCIATGTAVCQNLTAHQAVLNYSNSIYELAGVQNPLVAGVGIGVAKIIGILVVIFFVETVGRKRFLIIGSCGTILCHVTLGIAFIFRSHFSGSAAAKASPIIAIVAMFLYMFFINISWAGLMFVVATEVLPSSVRGIGMGFTVTCFWLLTFLTQATLETLMEFITVYGLFFFYAGTNMLALFFTWFCIPELSGKTLEQITERFR